MEECVTWNFEKQIFPTLFFYHVQVVQTFSNIVSQWGHLLFLSRIKEVYEASRIRHRKEATVFGNDESPKTYRRIIQVASTLAILAKIPQLPFELRDNDVPGKLFISD